MALYINYNAMTPEQQAIINKERRALPNQYVIEGAKVNVENTTHFNSAICTMNTNNHALVINIPEEAGEELLSQGWNVNKYQRKDSTYGYSIKASLQWRSKTGTPVNDSLRPTVYEIIKDSHGNDKRIPLDEEQFCTHFQNGKVTNCNVSLTPSVRMTTDGSIVITAFIKYMYIMNNKPRVEDPWADAFNQTSVSPNSDDPFAIENYTY